MTSWIPTVTSWFGPVTDIMLDMAGVSNGDRVLDVAAGAGEQTITAARRVGPDGYVLGRLDLFPDQQKALAAMKQALKPGGRVAAIVYTTPDKNTFFSTPAGIIRRRANLGPPVAGQPGPSASVRLA